MKTVLLKEHQQYLATDNWEQLRQWVLKRDNYTCVECGRDNCRLYIHHKTYKRWSKENLTDLVTHCYTCHERVHGRIIHAL